EHGDLWDACRPVHNVTVSDFYISQFPVTQALWKAVMKGKNPSNFQGDTLPVEQVPWDDITQQFLPELRNITGLQYRLPTEAEWEYAARGGKYHDEGYKYAGSDRLKDVGWFDENSDGGTKPVGQKSANQLGIYDMSGNVYEWCEDDWHGNYDQAPNDGRAWIDSPVRGAYRVNRGGGWDNDAQYCRTAFRYGWRADDRNFYLGFRLALSLQADGRPAFL
ncbi:MAG: formylglycine-generating enzyme family protein, partial [Bacteroidota bacterium]